MVSILPVYFCVLLDVICMFNIICGLSHFVVTTGNASCQLVAHTFDWMLPNLFDVNVCGSSIMDLTLASISFGRDSLSVHGIMD